MRKEALRPQAFKPKRAELSTEKSSEGLGEVYAREYEQQVLGAKPADQVNKGRPLRGSTRRPSRPLTLAPRRRSA